MNETPATQSTAPEATEPVIIPCKSIRTKMYYVMGRNAVDLTKSSPTSQYWCSRTATVIGPDDVCCSPEMCQGHRSCYEKEE
jgi:hypothetical protein